MTYDEKEEDLMRGRCGMGARGPGQGSRVGRCKGPGPMMGMGRQGMGFRGPMGFQRGMACGFEQMNFAGGQPRGFYREYFEENPRELLEEEREILKARLEDIEKELEE